MLKNKAIDNFRQSAINFWSYILPKLEKPYSIIRWLFWKIVFYITVALVMLGIVLIIGFHYNIPTFNQKLITIIPAISNSPFIILTPSHKIAGLTKNSQLLAPTKAISKKRTTRQRDTDSVSQQSVSKRTVSAAASAPPAQSAAAAQTAAPPAAGAPATGAANASNSLAGTATTTAIVVQQSTSSTTSIATEN